MATLLDRHEQLEKTVRSWGRKTRKELLFQLASMGLAETARSGDILENEPPLAKSVGYGIKKFYGQLDAVSIRFARHGYLLEFGVGRSRPVGSPQANASKQVWLGPIMARRTQDLADELAESYADLVSDEIRILVPGIIDTKVTGGSGTRLTDQLEDGQLKL